MKNFHVNPEESVLIHKDIKSKKSIGMHFGTFILTTEPILEPAQKISEIISKDSSFKGDFIIPSLELFILWKIINEKKIFRLYLKLK